MASDVNKRRREQWRRDHPEAYRRYRRAQRARNKARRKGAKGSFGTGDIEAIFKMQKGRCAYFRKCRTRLGGDYHIDHIKPICLGGTNAPSNIQLTCASCNRTKSGQDPVDFARDALGLLL